MGIRRLYLNNEELSIFPEARRMANDIWKVTRNRSFAMDKMFANPMRRAGLSVVSNIADGFERGSRAEFGRFLKIAKGSCGETRAQILVASDLNYISKNESEELTLTARRVAGRLSKLARSLTEDAQVKKPVRKVS
jgi:four helix bundle protein